MVGLFSFLLLFLAIIFWVFRTIVCLFATMQLEFAFVPYNAQFEIILLFITIVSIVLIARRNIVGATVYFGCSFAYFGSALYEKFSAGIPASEIILGDGLMELIGVIIPMLIFLDILLNKNKYNYFEAAKTDWYFQNDKFDRKYDERADRNQYKF